MASLKLYKTYLFRDKDPVIDELRTIIQRNEKGLTNAALRQVSIRSGVSVACLNGWFFKTTRRPQHATVKAVARSQGYEYKLKKIGR